MFSTLRSTFITPLDPEDIHHLSRSLDEALDEVEAAAHRISVFHDHHNGAREPVLRLCRSIGDCSRHLEQALDRLHDRKGTDEDCREVQRLADEAGLVHRQALSKLYESGGEPLAVWKQKEVYDTLSTAVNRCVAVAGVLDNIAVKGG